MLLIYLIVIYFIVYQYFILFRVSFIHTFFILLVVKSNSRRLTFATWWIVCIVPKPPRNRSTNQMEAKLFRCERITLSGIATFDFAKTTTVEALPRRLEIARTGRARSLSRPSKDDIGR